MDLSNIILENEIDETFLSEHKEVKEYIFKYLRNKLDDEENEKIEKLPKEKINKIEDSVKKENRKYFSLEKFRNFRDEEQTRKELEDIYANGIVVSKYAELKERYSKFKKDELYNILDTLNEITIFCAKYNRAGSELLDILNKSYDIDYKICYGLASLYDKNILSLKMDLIINMIKK